MKSTLVSTALITLLSCLLPGVTRAHPLSAEPINHPYVFTFDQFNVPEDPDDHLVSGGLLLLAELRCAACHEAPDTWRDRLKPAPGTDLAGVGSRLDSDTLWLMTRGPQHRKRGTLMPGMFANAEGDEEKVEALVSYMMTLKKEIPPMPAGDTANGKKLYHSVGCVACHEPASDAMPPGAEPGIEVERPGNASVPIALADAYDLNYLGRMLEHPLASRPSGRMPDMHLTEQEAADIAAYLHEGRAVEKAPERAVLAVPPQSPEDGKKLFHSLRCANCHADGAAEAQAVQMALPMSQLQLTTATNCLAENPEPGAARFGLNAFQRRALSLAIKHVQTHKAPTYNAMERVDWTLTRQNCYACHDRDGKGGPEDPRAAYFISPLTPKDTVPGLNRYPITLDGAGKRLTQEQLHTALINRIPGTQPHLSVRMPAFEALATPSLIADILTADKEAP